MKSSSPMPFQPPTLFASKPAAPAPLVPPEIALQELLPHNQQLVRFIMARQPISVADLCASYDDTGASMSAFLARLGYLKGKRWLLKQGEGRGALLSFNHDRTTRPQPAAPVRRAAAAPAVPATGHPAPPRRCNVMAGTYRPAQPAAQRPGSDDHTRLPSLRQGQRVPFTPGYIFD